LGIVALGILLALDRLGWSQAALSFLAGLGIVGIAIGFALQDIVKQFAAGVLLLMLRPFNIGDHVKIGVFEGQVMQVQLRATILKTVNGDEVLIPNADVYTTAITNTSRYRLRRHDIPLSLPPTTDLTQGRYAMALTGYRNFLTKNPDADLADNAQYGAGECFFAQARFDSALVEYKQVGTRWPSGDRAPAALYKVGLCQERLGRKDEAKQTFEDLVKRFPQSGEAQLARDRIGVKL